MAYDENLANRFRDMLKGIDGVTEKRMMGGLCFMLNGNMIGGANRSKSGEPHFTFRVGKPNDERAAELPGGTLMILGGRRMSGFYHVNPDEQTEDELRQWMALAVSHASSLPPK